MINWSKLWSLRHEPVSVLISIAVLLLTVTTIYLTVNQVIFRGAPIACGSHYFPDKKENCEGIEINDAQKSTTFPVGTIVAFFGRDEDLPEGWLVCDGQTIPENSPLSMDADAIEGGKQLPDLRGKFVRGTETPLDGVRLSTGGVDSTTINHSHVWGEFHANKWYSYDTDGSRFRVDVWDDGIDNEGKGYYPLVSKGATNAKLYTQASSETTENRPEYTELRYIIRVF